MGGPGFEPGHACVFVRLGFRRDPRARAGWLLHGFGICCIYQLRHSPGENVIAGVGRFELPQDGFGDRLTQPALTPIVGYLSIPSIP